MNAWLRSLALLRVIAEHGLRNMVSTELEIWYRDLSVTSHSTGPGARPEGEWGSAALHCSGLARRAKLLSVESCRRSQKVPWTF